MTNAKSEMPDLPAKMATPITVHALGTALAICGRLPKPSDASFVMTMVETQRSN